MADTQSQDPALKFAIDLARLADQTRCHNVVLLDVREKSPVTKYFLIATGTSDRQRRTVSDELIALGKNSGFPAWRSNGYETAKWIVVDFVDVVAHIFEEVSRSFYDLEMLWGDCPRVHWQLPGQEVSAPAIAPPAASEAPLEITEDREETTPLAGVPANAVSEPEVEEFVDEELFATQVTDNIDPEEVTTVEIISVEAPELRAPQPKKKSRAAGRKPAAKIAGKTRAAKAKVKTKAKAEATAKVAAKASAKKAAAKPAGRTKATKAKGAKTRPTAGKPPKLKKPVKARAAKSAGKKVVKKAAVRKPGAKKTAAKATAGKGRAGVKKAPRKGGGKS